MEKIEDELEMSVAEIYKALDFDENVFAVDCDGNEVIVYGSEYQNGLFDIEEFVGKISKGKKAFVISADTHGKQKIKYLELSKHYARIDKYLSLFSAKKIYSANVELFFETCALHQLTYRSLPKEPCATAHGTESSGAQRFNALIEAIFDKLNSSEFKKKVYSREYNAIRNFRSASKYIDALFVRYSRLLVLRIDFGFKVDFPNQKHSVTVVEAQEFFDRFLNNRRGNKIFEHMKGYIWKLESGKEKGYHFHAFFFFDGSKVQKDEYRSSEIGKYWIKLTGGRGIYHNCNANKRMYEKRGTCGIGMVSHQDTVMRGNLLFSVKYLFKKEQYLREKFKSKTRVYGKGHPPGSRVSRAGRPRMVGVNDSE